MLLTAGPCSDTLTLPLSSSEFLPPAALAPRLSAAKRCWQDVCDEGSGWRVCYVNYSHNINHHLLRTHHLFATGGREPSWFLPSWPKPPLHSGEGQTRCFFNVFFLYVKVTILEICNLWTPIFSHAIGMAVEMSTSVCFSVGLSIHLFGLDENISTIFGRTFRVLQGWYVFEDVALAPSTGPVGLFHWILD